MTERDPEAIVFDLRGSFPFRGTGEGYWLLGMRPEGTQKEIKHTHSRGALKKVYRQLQRLLVSLTHGTNSPFRAIQWDRPATSGTMGKPLSITKR